MGFQVDPVKEYSTSSDGESNTLPHADVVVGGSIPKTDGVRNVIVGTTSSRHLKDSTKELLSKMATEPAPIVTAPSVTPVDPSPVAVSVGVAATPITAAAVADDVAARAARLAEYNSRLVTENENLKKSVVPADVIDRLKAHEELDRLWLTDPAKAYDKKMSSLLGVAEDSPDIAPYRGYFESDLTQKRIGVPLTEDSDAARKAARTLAAIQLEMRARKADETKPIPSQAPQEDPAERIVAQHISTEKYPLMFALTEHDFGVKPERMIWAEINHRLQIGQLDPKMSDAQLINAVAPEIESRYEAQYQARVAKYTAAKRPPSQAQPVATSIEEKKPDPPSTAVPTLTNSTASVAPATPPAPAPKSIEKYKSEQSKRIAIIRSHSAKG